VPFGAGLFATYPTFCSASEGPLWVEPGGSIATGRMTAFGASRPLRRIPAIVSFLNPQPALSLAGGNRSSCPTAVSGDSLGCMDAGGALDLAPTGYCSALTRPERMRYPLTVE
jgi:hypothetical protein